MNPHRYNDAVAIAMYDVEDKRPVAVFHSIIVASRYVYNQRDEHGYEKLRNYIKNKHRMHRNRFNRVVCFRHANAQQQALLGDRTHVILDPRFDIKATVTLRNER